MRYLVTYKRHDDYITTRGRWVEARNIDEARREVRAELKRPNQPQAFVTTTPTAVLTKNID